MVIIDPAVPVCRCPNFLHFLSDHNHPYLCPSVLAFDETTHLRDLLFDSGADLLQPNHFMILGHAYASDSFWCARNNNNIIEIDNIYFPHNDFFENYDQIILNIN